MVEVTGARGCPRLAPRRVLRLYVIVLALVVVAPAASAGAFARPNPLAGRAMWIWELPSVDGGNVPQIIATAHRYGVGTLIIKSSDGTSQWSQFNAPLVTELHAAGIRVCAWQYVYGNHPVTEAYMGAYAVRDGADCLIIDAESEYEGKYISAQTYTRRLRALIGYGYPLALAGFPYVDYHPGFPYSVFLGPGGAQYNVPQMYWRDIGVTTDTVFAHTYSFNLPYQRPIFPLGQVFQNPPARQVIRFRQLSRAYGAAGVSWWDWQAAAPAAWVAISRPAGGLPGYTPYELMANVGQGANGDMVVWAQEHLISAGYPIAVSGDFGYHTLLEVEAFQTAHGLAADGIIGPLTWAALLRYRDARVDWVSGGGQHAVLAGALHTVRRDARPASSSSGAATIVAPVPRSASRPAKRDEIAGAGGAGRPGRRR
jgi:hypothetical protein